MRRKYIPHPREQLHQAAITKGEGEDDAWRRHVARVDVDQPEDEGGQGKGGQAHWRGIGELPCSGGSVKTGLGLTTEGRETNRVAGGGMGQRVSTIGPELMRGAAGGLLVDRDGIGSGAVGCGGHDVRRDETGRAGDSSSIAKAIDGDSAGCGDDKKR